MPTTLFDGDQIIYTCNCGSSIVIGDAPPTGKAKIFNIRCNCGAVFIIDWLNIKPGFITLYEGQFSQKESFFKKFKKLFIG